MADPHETTQVSEAPADAESAELLEAVRGLAAQVGVLQGELQALRSSVGGLPPDTDSHGWDDGRTAVRQDSPRWVRTLDSPEPRRPAVPRLFLEIAFLVTVAVLVAAAGLGGPVIVAVMAGAWALVALAEWVAAREATKREQALHASPFGAGVLAEDPSWFGPPADHELGGRSSLEVDRSQDTAARLPPAGDS